MSSRTCVSAESGAVLITRERMRQVSQEGYTAEHDRQHGSALVRAAVVYATPPGERVYTSVLIDGNGDRGDRFAMKPRGWPWHADDWKPSDDRIRELVKAGALIAAEIDRLQAGTTPTEKVS